MGGERFTGELEKLCGRRLRALPVGRPKKSSAKEGDRLSLWHLVFDWAVRVPRVPRGSVDLAKRVRDIKVTVRPPGADPSSPGSGC